MTRLIALLAATLLIAGLAFYGARRPDMPTSVVQAEVLSLQDDGTGRRIITVRFADGREQAIETLAPFFFKPGYKAKVGIYERPFLPDLYDIVGDWTIDAPQS